VSFGVERFAVGRRVSGSASLEVDDVRVFQHLPSKRMNHVFPGDRVIKLVFFATDALRTKLVIQPNLAIVFEARFLPR